MMTKETIMKGFLPYQGSTKSYDRTTYKPLEPRFSDNDQDDKEITDLKLFFDTLKVKDHMTISFHHHLRNGDKVMNMVLQELKSRGVKSLRIAPSAIFPVHAPLVELIKDKTVTDIVTNYVNGPVAEALSDGLLEGLLIMDTHGGRARAIETGDLEIDVAFIAASASDPYGNANGIDGTSPCGTLGYVIPDLMYAKKRVIVTDTIIDDMHQIDLEGCYVDDVLVVPSIGDSKRIKSGTTRPTRDPIQLKIAHDTAQLINDLSLIKDGMTFQTGAGGISLAVARDLKEMMIHQNVKGRYASGGITSMLVEMFEEGLFERLYDVQCFDNDAVDSYRRHDDHVMMDASQYANPYHKNPIAYGLDVVVLGASEIDLDFNVNVTTDSNNLLIGGSGGHADTANGAKVSIIVTTLLKGRMPSIRERVTTITTPGETVDVLVTERGIAINPRREDLIEALKQSALEIVSIETLMDWAHQMSGKPLSIPHEGRPIGLVRYFDGTITDIITQRK